MERTENCLLYYFISEHHADDEERRENGKVCVLYMIYSMHGRVHVVKSDVHFQLLYDTVTYRTEIREHMNATTECQIELLYIKKFY